MQVTTAIAQGIFFMSVVGPFWQSVAEAQGAMTPVFRLIDEVF